MMKNAFIAIVLFCCVSAQAVANEFKQSWLQEISGVYEGKVYSSGSTVRIVTTFVVDRDGAVHGKYNFFEGGKKIPGKLYQCEANIMGEIACKWKDKYGIGHLKVKFSKELIQFHGLYGSKGKTLPGDYWNGTRTE